jgi:hypothetical protein
VFCVQCLSNVFHVSSPSIMQPLGSRANAASGWLSSATLTFRGRDSIRVRSLYRSSILIWQPAVTGTLAGGGVREEHPCGGGVSTVKGVGEMSVVAPVQVPLQWAVQ